MRRSWSAPGALACTASARRSMRAQSTSSNPRRSRLQDRIVRDHHLPLIRKVAATGKPMIISTGMASAGEIDEAVATARGAGAKDQVLLKCTSTYPATPENSNILTIPHMRDLSAARWDYPTTPWAPAWR